jgi:hypothetical protein
MTDTPFSFGEGPPSAQHVTTRTSPGEALPVDSEIAELITTLGRCRIPAPRAAGDRHRCVRRRVDNQSQVSQLLLGGFEKTFGA